MDIPRCDMGVYDQRMNPIDGPVIEIEETGLLVVAHERLLARRRPIRLNSGIQFGQVDGRGLFNLMHLEMPFVGIGLEVSAVGLEHSPANQLVLNRLLDDAVLNVRPHKTATTLLRECRIIRHLVCRPHPEMSPHLRAVYVGLVLQGILKRRVIQRLVDDFRQGFLERVTQVVD